MKHLHLVMQKKNVSIVIWIEYLNIEHFHIYIPLYFSFSVSRCWHAWVPYTSHPLSCHVSQHYPNQDSSADSSSSSTTTTTSSSSSSSSSRRSFHTPGSS